MLGTLSRNGFSLRRCLAALAAISQLLGAIGAVPVRAFPCGAKSSIPFPCQDHPCGCASPEECWSGPCCCFTMSEKVAWARERGIVPPSHATAMSRHEEAAQYSPEADEADCPHCQKSTPSKGDCCSPGSTKAEKAKGSKSSQSGDLKDSSSLQGTHSKSTAKRTGNWVVGMFAKKCRGEGPGGLLKLDSSLAPTDPEDRDFLPIPAEDFVTFEVRTHSRPLSPPTPPPRVLDPIRA